MDLEADEDDHIIAKYRKKFQKARLSIGDNIEFGAQIIEPASYEELKSIISEIPHGASIIYAQNTSAVDEIQENLSKAGIHVSSSSEDFNDKRRHRIISINQVKTDRDDVRLIIFYGMPKSMLKICEESAKLGRDGKQSKCIVLWRSFDKDLYKRKLEPDENLSERRKRFFLDLLEKIFDFCSSSLCRRFLIKKYLDDQCLPNECYRDTCCDNCQKIILVRAPAKMIFEGVNEANMIDISNDLRLMLSAYYDFRELFASKNVLRGIMSNFDKRLRVDYFGMGRGKSEDYWNLIFSELIDRGFVKPSLNQITSRGFNFLRHKSQIIEKRADVEIRKHLEKKDIHITLENGKITITPKIKETFEEQTDHNSLTPLIDSTRKFKKLQPTPNIDDTKDIFDFGVTQTSGRQTSRREFLKRKAEETEQKKEEAAKPPPKKIDMRELFLEAFSRKNAENIYRQAPVEAEVPKAEEVSQEDVKPVVAPKIEESDDQNEVKPGCSHWRENYSSDEEIDDEHLQNLQEMRDLTHKPLPMPCDELLDYIERRSSELHKDTS